MQGKTYKNPQNYLNGSWQSLQVQQFRCLQFKTDQHRKQWCLLLYQTDQKDIIDSWNMDYLDFKPKWDVVAFKTTAKT